MELKVERNGITALHKPLVSVITVVLNGEKFISKTIESVLCQDYGNLEFIIIDGGSTDSTLDIIKRYEDKIDYWISEPDDGIYNAMNKGIDVALGDWIIFLGADDQFANSGSVSAFEHVFDNKYSVVFGNVLYGQRQFKSSLSKKTLQYNTLHHQSAFYNKKNFQSWRYDEDFELIADYELNLLIYRSNLCFEYVNKDVAKCGDFGASRSNAVTSFVETNLVRRKLIMSSLSLFLNFLFLLKSSLYYVKRFLMSGKKPFSQ